MLSAFWSGLGAELAKQWSARVLSPALAFWSAGLALVWWHANARGVRTHGWGAELRATGAVVSRVPAAEQVLLIVGGLIILAGSAYLAERLTLPLLRLLEGYWRHPRLLRTWLVGYRRWRYRKYRDTRTRLAALQRQGQGQGFDARMSADLGRARSVLRQMPNDDALGMPTRLGDILRAAELRPFKKYGLDTVACWYALWSVLPAEFRLEIVTARLSLDGAARTWLWGAAFALWAPWNLWAIPAAVIVAALAYYSGITGAAELFGELFTVAFDLYRFRLYDALHLPRPQSPRQEQDTDGPRLTNLLWGGLDEEGFTYASPAAPLAPPAASQEG
jgi:hypothetical protein